MLVPAWIFLVTVVDYRWLHRLGGSALPIMYNLGSACIVTVVKNSGKGGWLLDQLVGRVVLPQNVCGSCDRFDIFES